MIVPIILRQVSRWSIHSTAVLLLHLQLQTDLSPTPVHEGVRADCAQSVSHTYNNK